MGVEGHELYTADVTRTLPVSGTFTPRQRQVYDAGLRAAGGRHRRVPRRQRLPRRRTAPRWRCSRTASSSWACSSRPRRRSPRTRSSTAAGPCTASATCSASTCTTARTPASEVYRKGPLQPGYVLTVEPGLYFQPDDLTVPEDLRGHRRAHRGRHPRHRRRPGEPVGGAAARGRRRRGVDARPAAAVGPSRGGRSRAGAPTRRSTPA